MVPQKKTVIPNPNITCHGILMVSTMEERCGVFFKRISLIAPLQKKSAVPAKADTPTPATLQHTAVLRFSAPPVLNAEISTPIKASTRIIINAVIFHLFV